MSANDFESPIILVGTHRSGTTWTGNVLSQSGDLAYWSEPRQVWSFGNWFKGDDLLTESDATKQVRNHIRKRFKQFVQKRDGRQLCEKTPSNCFRIKFINEIYPNARFILLIRDGRAVFRSTEEIKKKGADWSRIRQRLAESSWVDIPAFFSRIPWLFNKLRGKPNRFWGVRPPGWKEWLKNDSMPLVVAKQWKESIERAVQDLDNLPKERVLKINYEFMMKNPAEICDQLEPFVSVNDFSSIAKFLKNTADVTRANKWKSELSHETLDEIRPILEPALARLGYDWD